MRNVFLLTIFVSIGTAAAAEGDPIVFSAVGLNAASITPVRDSFRAAIGGGTVAGANGSFGGVRREINWDGVPDALAAPNSLPANFFNTASPRGVVFSTPGTGFEVSANAGVAPIEFGDINPTYPSSFATFSPQRLFTAVGSNITDVTFFLPGTSTQALTSAFGAVFTDVDLASASSIQYFDALNNSLGVFFVPSLTGSETLSFLGVLFDSPVVSRVRITSGNGPLGGTDGVAGLDVVAMDDFIYGEPTTQPTSLVPEPTSLLLLGTGGLGLIAKLRRQKKQSA